MGRQFIRALLLIALLATALDSAAQKAQLSGHVTDPEASVVQNAEITLFQSGTQVAQAMSDSAGNFAVHDLAPGVYRIEILAPAFARTINENVALAEGQSLTLDVQLRVESVKTEIGVEAGGAAQVETESSQVSGKLTEKEVLSYGLNGRNFSQLIAL